MNPELTLLYVHGQSIGYGRYGIELHRALARQGVGVYDHQGGPDDALSHHLRDGANEKLTNVVCWVSVPTHARGWFAGQHAAISTMWEASLLPESFRDTLHEFDTVIVPSPHNVELFSAYHDNVKLVLLGVDPEQWHYVQRRPPTHEFRFLIGGSGERKGIDLAYRAFRAVFRTWPKDGPIPRLILKAPRGDQGQYYGDRVEVIGGRISADAEIALYETAHCYLQPSRGEGFGLQPLQAIAQGCPTILTGAHGHESFAHLGYPISAEKTQSAYFIYGEAGDWWEPSFEELCERMHHVYTHYDEATAFAKDSAAEVSTHWTWANTATQFQTAFGDELTKPYTGSGAWKAPEAKLYEVILTKDWQTHVAGRLFHFKKGETYHEVADVKRILFSAGLLDPACIESYRINEDDFFDSGLTVGQMGDFVNYSASHSHCYACGQRLNATPSRADEIFAELEAKAAQ